MTNREVKVLEGCIVAILRDYCDSYPSDTLEVERDIQRLSLVSQTRGLGVFLLDLPALGKHFDKCLSTGVFVAPALPLGTTRWPHSPIQRLFSGLLIRVFERESGRLRSDVDVNVVAFLRQLFFFAKGYNHDCSFTRSKRAVQEFYDVEREIRTSTLNWADARMDLSRLRDLHFCDPCVDQNPAGESRPETPQFSACPDTFGRKLQFVCDLVATEFGEFNPGDWQAKHGPGAVSDLKGDVTKYSFPSWSEKLDRVFPYADHAFINWSDWCSELDRPASNDESPSKLLMVPKTAKGPRLIASEPVAHQWCQQMILNYLLAGIQKSSLRKSLSLKDQEPSRRLVLEASRSRDYATIDLSAASDRISCWIVERTFRANSSLLDALHASRTRFIENGTNVPLSNEPTRLTLRKFSTMGSACTFPIQSIIFSMVCIATILDEENQNVTIRNIRKIGRRVRVFGDDIIIPNAHFEGVCRNLSVLGLKVNHDKSFSEGNFRESCGMDAFQGYDVTPARFNRVSDIARPASLNSTLDASNNFFMKGYWRTADYIRSTLPLWIHNKIPVVAHDSGQTGLSSFCGNFLDFLKSRWNPALQRVEVRVAKLRSKVLRCDQTGRHDLFQYFTERPAPDTIWSPGRVRDSSVYLTLGWEPLSSF